MGMCASNERPESNPNRSNTVMKPGKNTWFPESVPTLKTASREDITSLYNVGRMLGTGKFGQVRMASLKCNPSLQYAIKTVNIDEIKDELFRLETELNVLKKMDHCNIIKFYETYTDGKRFHIVMELCNGGELFDVLMAKEKFTETETLSLMHQILSTIAYLHKFNYCHRDLKPENFLFKSKDPNSQIKLIDFGLASKITSTKALMSTIAGSPYYVAPEVLEGSYTFACDIWSAGIIMYVLLCGKTPVDGDDSEAILDNVKNKRFIIDEVIWKSISTDGQNLFKKMTNLNPSKRPTAEQCLSDSWFNKIKKEINPKQSILNIATSVNNINPLKTMLFSLLPRFINEKDKTDIVDTFQGLDESGFGLLSTNILRKHLIECMIEQSKIDDIIKQADSDEDGFVTFGEFLCLTIDTKSIDFKESLVCLFKYLDNTGKGMIGQEQLLMAFKREANIFSPNEIKSLWKAYDKEASSLIGIEEFIKMFI